MKRFAAAAMMSCTMFMTVFAGAQTPPPVKPRYESRAVHDPNGIGKFYLGREIASVMGYQGWTWLERPEREREENVSKLVPSLDIKAGDVVADLGAGSGFHTLKMSKLVGPEGKVYAVDIQPQMLDIIRQRLKKEKITNVELVQNTEKKLKLPAESLDMILMVDVYHELSYPYEMTVEMVKALKPGGRMIFVEFRLEDEKVPILTVHRMSEKQVIKEMAPHGVKHARTLGHLPWQHVIIFEKVAEKKTDEAKKDR